MKEKNPFRDLELELARLREDPHADQQRIAEIEHFLYEREKERRLLGLSDERPHTSS